MLRLRVLQQLPRRVETRLARAAHETAGFCKHTEKYNVNLIIIKLIGHTTCGLRKTTVERVTHTSGAIWASGKVSHVNVRSFLILSTVELSRGYVLARSRKKPRPINRSFRYKLRSISPRASTT